MSATSLSFNSNILSDIADSSSSTNLFNKDLTKLAKDLKTGNLSAAKQDYVTLSSDAQAAASSSALASGTTSSTSGDSTSASLAKELNQVGTDLSSGDLSAAQTDMATLAQSVLKAITAAVTAEENALAKNSDQASSTTSSQSTTTASNSSSSSSTSSTSSTGKSNDQTLYSAAFSAMVEKTYAKLAATSSPAPTLTA